MTRSLHTVKESHKSLADTSWEERRSMSAAELVELMGPLHVNHRDFSPRPRTLLPMPNLTGINGDVIERYDGTMLGQVKHIIGWVFA